MSLSSFKRRLEAVLGVLSRALNGQTDRTLKVINVTLLNFDAGSDNKQLI